MSFIIILLLIFVTSSCSSYNVSNENTGDTAISIKLSGGATGEQIDLKYPISIYCINQNDFSIINKDFNEGETLNFSLKEDEYSINVFCGLNKDSYNIGKDFEQKPVIEMRSNGASEHTLMAAHTVMDIKKATEISLIPVYVVTSVEFELTNIPEEVENINIIISPVCNSYNIEGKTIDVNGSANIECYKEGVIWSSGIRYLFPSNSSTTKINIAMDYGDETKSYSYTLMKKLEKGTPYKFTGEFESDGENGSGGLDMNGEFEISGWDMKEEISLDFNDGTIDDGTDDGNKGGDNEDDGDEENNSSNEDIETFYVNEIPSAFDIFGPFFVWKSEPVNNKEAIVTVIAPTQWSEILAADALATLEGYSVDEITGWRMFTEEEAREFFVDFDGGESEINDILYENGHNIFYYEDSSARYLCNNAKSTIRFTGSLRVYPAGEKTEYYLRPIKTMRLKIQ